MNKILVDNKKEKIEGNIEKYTFNKDDTISLELDHENKELFLVITNGANITFNILAKNTNLTFHIKLGKGTKLYLNTLVLDGSTNAYINLEEENACLNYHNSIVSNKNSINYINIKHFSKNTYSYVFNHGFSINHSDIIFDVNGYIEKEASKCICKQDNQIIQIDNSKSQINPNLYIDNYDIEASHSAYIGFFKEEELFYLMSRGLNPQGAKFLLTKAFLIGYVQDEKTYGLYTNEIMKYFGKEVLP